MGSELRKDVIKSDATMVLSGGSINFGHGTRKKSHVHPVGCNELGVGRSLKLLDLRLCFR